MKAEKKYDLSLKGAGQVSKMKKQLLKLMDGVGRNTSG